MSTESKISRRQFIQLAGLTATGTFLAACNTVTPQTLASPTEAPLPTAPVRAPAVIKPHKVTIEIDGWAVPVTSQVLAKPLFMDFTQQTGIEIEFIPRTGTKETELNRLSSAVQAGTSPYDII